MNSTRLTLLFFFVTRFITLGVFGQDPQFSNFFCNKLYYNPAYAGIDYGLNVNLAYRRQWPNISGQFQTINASLDQSIRISRGVGGAGFLAVLNTEGDGLLQKITLGVPISVRVRLGSKSLVQFGVMPAVAFNSINWDRFVFNGQLSPYYGKIYPSTFIAPDDGSSNNAYADILNMGCVFRYESKSSESNSFYLYRKFEVGLSGFHLSQPNQSFTRSKAPLPAKYVFFSAYTTAISLNHSGFFLLEPAVQCELQWKMFSYMLGINTSFTDYNINFGLWYRNKSIDMQNTDAIIVLFGYRFMVDKYSNTVLTASLSYDITVSALSDATCGAPEITINLCFNNSSLFHDRPDACDKECPTRLGKKKIPRKK